MAKGTFRRDWLPTWESYSQRHGLVLIGRGDERRMVCSIHAGTRDSLTINIKSGAWKCNSCGAAGGDVLAHFRAVHGATFVEAARALDAWEERDDEQRPAPAARPRPAVERAARPDPEDDAAKARKRALAGRLWAQSLPITADTPAAIYLMGSRCCVLPPSDSDLRWLPELALFGFVGAALVGRMTLATDHDDFRGLHLTWLELGDEGWRRTERRYLGPKAGCVVRIFSDECVTAGLAVAEGVETALSIAHAYMPVWASLDAGNLDALPVLAGIESLLIGADNDRAGIAAAKACASRWAAAGREVAIAMPPTPGSDVNDVARLAA